MITPAFLCLNLVSLSLNLFVGFALSFAEWDERYAFLGLFSLTCWGIIFMFQIRLFQRYIKQFRDLKNKKRKTHKHKVKIPSV